MSQLDSINNLTTAVVFFAFNRPEKLQNTIKSYLSCSNAQTKDIIVYIDGPRKIQERNLTERCFDVSSELLPNADIIYREKNMGLKNSIYAGISDVLKIYDSVIVIEDDLKLEPQFY
ncbi:hypothetical protein, partial [Aliivibrio kagoshimensis]|uniref:hypothetical protein n=1 Tax=Aliivibrio kagoshimensis TaxID=2910230 RepID=UPI003D1420F2